MKDGLDRGNSSQMNCKFLNGTPVPGLDEYVWDQLTFQVILHLDQEFLNEPPVPGLDEYVWDQLTFQVILNLDQEFLNGTRRIRLGSAEFPGYSWTRSFRKAFSIYYRNKCSVIR